MSYDVDKIYNINTVDDADNIDAVNGIDEIVDNFLFRPKIV